MTVAAVRQFLTHGQHLRQKQTLETVLSTLNGHTLRLQPHYTRSVLSSASLTASYIKNWLVRNQESLNGGTVRKILGLGDYKHPIWKYRLDQEAKRTQYSQVLARLQLEEQRLALLRKFAAPHAEQEHRAVQESIRQVQTTLSLMAPTVTGSLHPSTPTDDSTHDKSTAPSSGLKLRGLFIRLAGPRKGNRAMKWERAVGAVSINSVDYVVAEEAQIQLPSKAGIFGLYLRIVYQKVGERPFSGKRHPGDLTLFDGLREYRPF